MSKLVIVPAGFLLGVMQLAAASAGGSLGALLGAFVLGFAVIPLVRLFDVPATEPWLLPLLAACASAAGVAMLSHLPAGVMAMCPVLAASTAWLFASLRDRASVRCEQDGCHKTVPSARDLVKCPRCSLETCVECWNPIRTRCRSCEEHGVPILPMSTAWWTANFKNVVKIGKCESCLQPGNDLPRCEKCGTPQCRECWDSNNAQCVRCGWAPPELPHALEPHVRRRRRGGRRGEIRNA